MRSKGTEIRFPEALCPAERCLFTSGAIGQVPVRHSGEKTCIRRAHGVPAKGPANALKAMFFIAALPHAQTPALFIQEWLIQSSEKSSIPLERCVCSF